MLICGLKFDIYVPVKGQGYLYDVIIFRFLLDLWFENYESNKTKHRFMVGVFGNEFLQNVLCDCGIPYWDLSLMGCTILQGDYDGVLIDCGNHAIATALYCPKVKTYLYAKYLSERVC